MQEKYRQGGLYKEKSGKKISDHSELVSRNYELLPHCAIDSGFAMVNLEENTIL